MYQEWPFFRSLVDNAQISVGTADLSTARQYVGLARDGSAAPRIWARIEHEFSLTERGLLAVTGQKRILDNLPVLQESIELRNPYVDPMHAIQVDLLRRLRAVTADGQGEQEEELRYAVQHTINGIASGLQSTG
jgi:phosphoenolpyruvate carboxylase